VRESGGGLGGLGDGGLEVDVLAGVKPEDLFSARLALVERLGCSGGQYGSVLPWMISRGLLARSSAAQFSGQLPIRCAGVDTIGGKVAPMKAARMPAASTSR
jgi:hypothetical protein